MRRQAFITISIFLIVSCNFNQDKKQPRTFYNNISGWDIIYLPIIKPYRATSVDKGETWSLGLDEINTVDVSSFGVSKNFIYGHGQKGWFLFDVNSKLFAVYPTQEELNHSLQSFNVPIKTIASCNLYFDTLSKGKNCYWFPKDGQSYPSYSDFVPNEVKQIKVIETAHAQPDFELNQKLKATTDKIYFFRISYNKKQNDLYYLSFDNSQPILVKDSLLVPFFTDKKQFDITLYTPYPVAQEKGISEEKRFLKSKIIYVQ